MDFVESIIDLICKILPYLFTLIGVYFGFSLSRNMSIVTEGNKIWNDWISFTNSFADFQKTVKVWEALSANYRLDNRQDRWVWKNPKMLTEDDIFRIETINALVDRRLDEMIHYFNDLNIVHKQILNDIDGSLMVIWDWFTFIDIEKFGVFERTKENSIYIPRAGKYCVDEIYGKHQQMLEELQAKIKKPKFIKAYRKVTYR